MSILKSANEQTQLAGELIRRTIEGMLDSQSAAAPAQPVETPDISVQGKIINIAA